MFIIIVSTWNSNSFNTKMFKPIKSIKFFTII